MEFKIIGASEVDEFINSAEQGTKKNPWPVEITLRDEINNDEMIVLLSVSEITAGKNPLHEEVYFFEGFLIGSFFKERDSSQGVTGTITFSGDQIAGSLTPRYGACLIEELSRA